MYGSGTAPPKWAYPQNFHLSIFPEGIGSKRRQTPDKSLPRVPCFATGASALMSPLMGYGLVSLLAAGGRWLPQIVEDRLVLTKYGFETAGVRYDRVPRWMFLRNRVPALMMRAMCSTYRYCVSCRDSCINLLDFLLCKHGLQSTGASGINHLPCNRNATESYMHYA